MRNKQNIVRTDFWHWLFFKRTIIPFSAIGVVAILVYAALNTHFEYWWNKIEMPIVFGTFIFSLTISFKSFFKEWEDSLPKLLSVAFIHNNKLIMLCKNAGLSHEGDIRAWAQQIGIQMADHTQLLKLTLESQPSISKRKKVGKQWYLSFYYRVCLKDLPIFQEEKKIRVKVLTKIKDGYFLKWDILKNKVGYDDENFAKHPKILPDILDLEKI
jgi:hypothetical protein